MWKERGTCLSITDAKQLRERVETVKLLGLRWKGDERWFKGLLSLCRCFQKSLQFPEATVTMSRIETTDIIPLHAIRFRPMQALKMDDFPGGCTNPLKCHGTLSRTSLNKSYFYPGVKVTLFTFISASAKIIRVSYSLLKGSELFRVEMHLSRAHIISLLHIYKCVALVEQQHASASSPWAR